MCNQEKEDCTRPFVSVIVPIFNVEKQIEICLDSLQRQTMKRIECILLDDGPQRNNCQTVCRKIS